MDFILNVLWVFLAVFLGGYILLFGRRALWATLGIVGLVATANLLAVFVAGVDSGRDLVGLQDWALLGIVLAVAVLGVVVGRVTPPLAAMLIGFLAGADLALWLYDIAAYVIGFTQLSAQITLWIGLIIIVIGGLCGLWFVREFQNEALILITVVLGTQIIGLGLGLSTSSSFTAVIALSLALFGLIRQYADYLRELKVSSPDAENVISVP
jgi:hypothetical protein